MSEPIKNIDDIIRDLAARKEAKLVKIYKETRDTVIQPTSVEEKYQRETSEELLKTGTLIDDLIGGGMLPESTMLLYGEYGSGKTETCLTMAVLCPYIVIYIDTENSFSAVRIKEICDARGLDYKAVFKKIILYQPKTWIEQMQVINSIPSPADVDGKIGLIILDSVSKLFRGIEFAGRQELQVRQPPIRECMIELGNIAQVYRCAVIFTTQIYETPVIQAFMPEWTGYKPVGGPSIKHQPKYVVFLRRGKGNIRIARLTDADNKPLAERPFQITAAGITDLPKTKAAEKEIKKSEEYQKSQESVLLEESSRQKKEKQKEEEKMEQ